MTSGGGILETDLTRQVPAHEIRMYLLEGGIRLHLFINSGHQFLQPSQFDRCRRRFFRIVLESLQPAQRLAQGDCMFAERHRQSQIWFVAWGHETSLAVA